MLNNLINNLHSLLESIFLLKELIEHPIDQLFEIITLTGKEFSYLMEIAGKKKFICLGLVEELDVYIANWIYFVELGRKH